MWNRAVVNGGRPKKTRLVRDRAEIDRVQATLIAFAAPACRACRVSHLEGSTLGLELDLLCTHGTFCSNYLKTHKGVLHAHALLENHKREWYIRIGIGKTMPDPR